MGWRNANDRTDADERDRAADQTNNPREAEQLRSLAEATRREADGSTSYSSARALNGKSN